VRVNDIIYARDDKMFLYRSGGGGGGGLMGMLKGGIQGGLAGLLLKGKGAGGLKKQDNAAAAAAGCGIGALDLPRPGAVLVRPGGAQ